MNIVDRFKEFWARWDWEAKEPTLTLEERINNQIKCLAVDVEKSLHEVSNAAGYGAHLDKRIAKLEHKSANVDAHYVRTMATAFDEKHQAFVSEVEAKANTRFDATSQRLRDSEEACEKRCEVLQAQIHDLTGEVAAVAESLRKALARLRAVGEGN